MRCTRSYADGKIVSSSHAGSPDEEEGHVASMLQKGPAHHKHGAAKQPHGPSHAAPPSPPKGKISQDHFADAKHSGAGSVPDFSGAGAGMSSAGDTPAFADGGMPDKVEPPSLWDTVKERAKALVPGMSQGTQPKHMDNGKMQNINDIIDSKS